ncbi:helicase-related protein [Aurantimonas sp. VKM B-3413]|uniref:helicase-related protein n=1 Tax=Aurantimonas sp. VKM B-3413 TaxID=2779401 RepID=UPI001E451C13|nr:helicase-related protein [Aurantimonas sp. VKM B-3413]MCB8840722.1 helicase [Aurantimonas sp. VKM B-3413]
MTELRPVPDTIRFDGTNVTAVLGPTNTGKTFLAIERMIAHSSGTIGLPLRLLAREVYAKVVDRVGVGAVALITGEEKIKPPNARYFVCTVEAMPRNPGTAFVAIDEVQLANDLERGHVFTDRILHCRGSQETLLLGAPTMQTVLAKLLKGVQTTTRPRLSNLTYAGSKKITRLPRRSAIVAFSADEVYAIAELIRRQRGGAAVVLGALSPRTRNAQVALYQSGDVDFLVATDAIGMGLNLDVDHVAFAQDWKFDGFQYRQLTPAEFGQIAGRAGRHVRDGTFGVTGRVDPLPTELVEALEAHRFAPIKVLQWRSSDLDFSSIAALTASLERPPPSAELTRALPSVDQRALQFLSRDPAIERRATGRRRVELLWEACKLPDYRRIAPAQHAEIIAAIYGDLTDNGHVSEDYMASQVHRADRTEGDLDTLSQRIAEIRTWTYISHRPDWLADPTHWQEKTRDIEDRLSDALHDRLTKRFVDRRTSVLMRRLRENAFMEAEIASDGTVVVEGHPVGELQGFRFTPDTKAEGADGRAVRAAAQKALAGEFDKRAERFTNAPNGDLALASDGLVRWLGAPVASLSAGEDALKPKVVILADEQLAGPSRDKVAARAERFLTYQVSTILKPLLDLKSAEGLEGTARGLAFRLTENFGLLQRRDVSEEVRALDQASRAALRRCGVRFGAYHIFVPTLIKPAPASLLTLLWAIQNDGRDRPGFGEVTHLLATGRTSAVADPSFDPVFYALAGYRLLGRRAVRIDILERLADLIRPALAWKPGSGKRPEGAFNGSQFLVTPAMMSILGATAEDMDEILKGLGYRPQGMEADGVESELKRLDAEAAAAAEAQRAEVAEKAARAAAEAAASAEAPQPAEAASAEMPADTAAPEDAAAAEPAAAEPALVAVDAAAETAASVATDDGAPAAVEAATATPPAEMAAADPAETESPEAPASDETTAVASSSETPEDAATEKAEASAAPEAEVEAQAGEAAATQETGEASEASAPGTAEAEASQPAEPRIVQVWRPHRGGDRNANRERHGRRNRRPAPGQAQGAPGGEETAGVDGDRPPRHQRHGKGGGDRPGQEERQQRFGKGGPKGGKGRPQKDRPDRPERNDRQDGGSRRPDNKPQRVDPDSPFAKLAALKEKLGR